MYYFLCHLHDIEKNHRTIEEIVFCYQNCSVLLWEKNCSTDREKLLKFEAEGLELANFLKTLEQFIQTVKGNRMLF